MQLEAELGRSRAAMARLQFVARSCRLSLTATLMVLDTAVLLYDLARLLEAFA